MAQPFPLKEGDRRPYYRVTLRDNNGDAIDLNANDITSITFNFISVDSATPVVDDGATNIIQVGNPPSATNQGVIEYQWGATDTTTVGRYKADFKITFDDGTTETFPNDDYEYVEIIPKIGT